MCANAPATSSQTHQAIGVEMATKRPVLLQAHQSERATQAAEARNTHTFMVAKDATKPEIRRAVQKRFDVAVVSVRTLVTHGKVRRRGNSVGRRPNEKKAMVTLREGERLDLMAAE